MMNISQKFESERNRHLLENVSYITVLQMFNVIAPLITYPYLVRVIGRDRYGVFITAQVLVSYISLFVIWGSDSVCAKYISIHRDDKQKLSEIFSSVLAGRAMMWFLGLLTYLLIVYLTPTYRESSLVFVLTYGMVLFDVLFPQYLFQGLEKMKYATFVVVMVRLLFIMLVFTLVRDSSDLYRVPLLYSIGYLLGGLASLYVIFCRLGLRLTKVSGGKVLSLVKESSPIFASDLITAIKDRFNILLMGGLIGMANVVVYDLGMKINLLVTKPTEILRIALFPRAAKDRSIPEVRRTMIVSFLISVLLVAMVNAALPYIVRLFLNEDIDLLPLRLFSMAPLLLSVSVLIAFNVFVAFGYNKYVLNSILITTGCYLLLLISCYFTHHLNTLMIFVLISMVAYLVEFIYRVVMFKKIVRKTLSQG